uniref:Fe2OG dioxygenase domain-containing protein n=1 Tax=Ananas comosus var. bracteatus TaxID=296719 RepID=A0A6V7QZB1_ANACO
MGFEDQKNDQLQIPKIRFEGLDLSQAGSPRWDSARSHVIAALQTYGCFDAVYGVTARSSRGCSSAGPYWTSSSSVCRRSSRTLRQALSRLHWEFAPECIPLPIREPPCGRRAQPRERREVRPPSLAWRKSQLLVPMLRPSKISSWYAYMLQYTATIFNLFLFSLASNAAWTVGKHMRELEQMVEKMILESMGLEKYFVRQVESLEYGLRLTEYGIPSDQENKLAMRSHVDPNMVTVICQHQVGGLEVLSKDGDWITVEPSLDAFTVVTGEAFGVLTNGRLEPCRHRVKITSNESGKRYSALFSSRPKDGVVVHPAEELIDEAHPQQYRPCNYNEYLRYLATTKEEKSMKAFCGVAKEETRA